MSWSPLSFPTHGCRRLTFFWLSLPSFTSLTEAPSSLSCLSSSLGFLLFVTIIYSLGCAENFPLFFFQSCLSLCSGSVDNLGLRYQDVPIKVAAPWKIGQMRAHGQVTSCPSYASSGGGKTEALLLLITYRSFRKLMKNYLALSSHVVIRQMGRWKRRPTKQPYRTGLYFLSIIHGVRITLLITKVSTLHGLFFFLFFLLDQPGQWPEKTKTSRISV